MKPFKFEGIAEGCVGVDRVGREYELSLVPDCASKKHPIAGVVVGLLPYRFTRSGRYISEDVENPRDLIGIRGDCDPLEAIDDPIKVTNDPVNHPAHYTQHPSGVECIQITEHMGFNLGNAVKYIWRADLKDDAVEDLRKAKWYIERELMKRVGGVSND